MAKRTVEIELKAIDSASNVFTRAGEALEKTTDNLHSAFGRGSTFQESAELLKGGGALIGLRVAGEVLKESSARALELKDQLNEGKISAGEFAEKLAESIPVYGSIIQAGRSIHELFTGEEAEARKVTEQAKLANDIIDARNRLDLEGKKILEENLAVIHAIAAERAKINAGPERTALITAGEAEQHGSESTTQRFADERAKLQKDYEEQTKLLNQRLAEAQARTVAVKDPNLLGSAAIHEPDVNEVKTAQHAIETAKKTHNEMMAKLEQDQRDTLNEIASKAQDERQKAIDDEFKRQQEAKKKSVDDYIEQNKREFEAWKEQQANLAKAAEDEFPELNRPLFSGPDWHMTPADEELHRLLFDKGPISRAQPAQGIRFEDIGLRTGAGDFARETDTSKPIVDQLGQIHRQIQNDNQDMKRSLRDIAQAARNGQVIIVGAN